MMKDTRAYLKVVTDELKSRIEEKIQQDRCFTIDKLSSFFSEISRTVFYEIVSGDLSCRKNVPGGFLEF